MKYISVDYLLKHQQRYQRNDYGDSYIVSCVPTEVIINENGENTIEIDDSEKEI